MKRFKKSKIFLYLLLIVTVALLVHYYPLIRANWRIYNAGRKEWMVRENAREECEKLGENSKWVEGWLGNKYKCLVRVDSQERCEKLDEDYEWKDVGGKFMCISDICWRNEFEDQCLTQINCKWHEAENLCCGKDDNIENTPGHGLVCCPKGSLCD